MVDIDSPGGGNYQTSQLSYKKTKQYLYVLQLLIHINHIYRVTAYKIDKTHKILKIYYELIGVVWPHKTRAQLLIRIELLLAVTNVIFSFINLFVYLSWLSNWWFNNLILNVWYTWVKNSFAYFETEVIGVFCRR